MNDITFTDRIKITAYFYQYCDDHNEAKSIDNFICWLIVHHMLDNKEVQKELDRLTRKHIKEVK